MENASSALVVVFQFVSAVAFGQSEPQVSAWDVLMRENAILIENATPIEREILQLLTPAQIHDYLHGAESSGIVLMTGERLDELLARQGVTSFDLSWYSIDGGGGSVTGGEFKVTGSIGQVDAGTLGGGELILTGGFLSIGLPPPMEDPCLTGDALFCDGFESGDTTMWSSSAN